MLILFKVKDIFNHIILPDILSHNWQSLYNFAISCKGAYIIVINYLDKLESLCISNCNNVKLLNFGKKKDILMKNCSFKDGLCLIMKKKGHSVYYNRCIQLSKNYTRTYVVDNVSNIHANAYININNILGVKSICCYALWISYKVDVLSHKIMSSILSHINVYIMYNIKSFEVFNALPNLKSLIICKLVIFNSKVQPLVEFWNKSKIPYIYIQWYHGEKYNSFGKLQLYNFPAIQASLLAKLQKIMTEKRVIYVNEEYRKIIQHRVTKKGLYKIKYITMKDFEEIIREAKITDKSFVKRI